MATQNAIGTTIPIPVASGGTGATTLTSNSLLLGNGTSAISALGAMTNGQIVIGSTSATPVIASLTAGTGITITPAAGAITIASSGGGVTSLAGDSGGALTGALSLVTANSTVKFAGSGTTITHDFGATTNTVLGGSLPSLTTGVRNTGLGQSILTAVTSGNNNTAVGWEALKVTVNSTGGGNTAIGSSTLDALTGGSGNNTAVGFAAGGNITTGTQNVFIGASAGIGFATGGESSNISIGTAGNETTNTSNTLQIGNATGTGTAQINKALICGITGITVTGTAILISTGNQLGIAVSSQKFKLDVKDTGADTDFIYKLRPVTFVWDKSSNEGLKDASDARQFGLIAEEVVAVQPELVGFTKEGAPLNVHYDRLVPMLLNEIQRLEKRITALERK